MQTQESPTRIDEPAIKSAESIFTGIKPNGYLWGTDLWFDIYLRGELLSSSVTSGRALSNLHAFASNRGVDLEAAYAEYVRAFAAEIARKALISPAVLVANILEDNDPIDTDAIEAEFELANRHDESTKPLSNESDGCKKAVCAAWQLCIAPACRARVNR